MPRSSVDAVYWVPQTMVPKLAFLMSGDQPLEDIEQDGLRRPGVATVSGATTTTLVIFVGVVGAELR